MGGGGGRISFNSTSYPYTALVLGGNSTDIWDYYGKTGEYGTIYPDIIAPGRVTTLAVSTTGVLGELRLQWSVPGGDGYYKRELVTGSRYFIQYSSNPLQNWSTGQANIAVSTSSARVLSVTNRVITSLQLSTSHYFRIWYADENSNLSKISNGATLYMPVSSPPAAFNLLSPLNNSTTFWGMPCFDWEDTTDPDGDTVYYEIRYSTDSNFGIYASSSGLTESWYIPQNWLYNNYTYYWKVKAYSTWGLYIWTSTWSVRVRDDYWDAPPNAFDLVLPSNGSILTTAIPMFDWGNTTDPDPGDIVSYEILYSTDSEFNVYISSAELSVSSHTPVSALTEDKQYFWVVRAISNGKYTWSNSTGSFYINTVDVPPQAFNLLSPANNSILTASPASLDWEDTADNDLCDTVIYELNISSSRVFVSYTSSAGLVSSEYTLQAVLSEGATYYWRVKATGSSGAYTWASSSWSFYLQDTTQPPPPVIPVLSVNPSSLDFGIMDPNTSQSMGFEIINSGNGDLNGTIVTDVSWLTLDQTSFNSNYSAINVTANTTSIGVGQQHTGTISITSNGGNANITVTVTPTCVYVCPNPANNTIKFWGSGVPYSTIKIYTISGKLVRTLKEVVGSDTLVWNLTNTENEKLASGVYLYRTSNPKEKNEGKFAVIH